MRTSIIQRKLTISHPGDEYEHEADRVADQVMRMPAPQSYVTRTTEVTPDVQAQINGLRGGGQPLSGSVRAFFEPRFGRDFAGVRIHTDQRAAETARALKARAYTVGRDIVLGTGEYVPGTGAGKRLLAHELTHVVQQQAMNAPSLQRLTEAEKAEDLKSPKYAGNRRLEKAFDNDPPLGIGENGEAVRLVQEGLVADGFAMPRSTKPTGELDGAFGEETFSVVKQFQVKHGLDVDGVVGRQTMGELDSLAPQGRVLPECPEVGSPQGISGFSGFVPTQGNMCGFPIPATLPTVDVPDHIRGTASPPANVGMNDRIPPRVDTPVTISVSGPKVPFTLAVAGQGLDNGSATINGQPFVILNSSTTVNLRGFFQTKPGHSGRLRLEARQSGMLLDRSDGFSVSSIPENMTFVLDHPVVGNNRGFVATGTWESDSDVNSDLDEATIDEEIEVTSSNGMGAPATSGPLDADAAAIADFHQVGPLAALRVAGRFINMNQTQKFNDDRSASLAVPMTNSGYVILHVTFASGGTPPFNIVSVKVPASVTANGIQSNAGDIVADPAGTGTITVIQPV